MEPEACFKHPETLLYLSVRVSASKNPGTARERYVFLSSSGSWGSERVNKHLDMASGSVIVLAET